MQRFSLITRSYALPELVKYLVDAQLPPALARWLSDASYAAIHVCDVGLLQASDDDIWAYANSESLVIVRKDEDFALRAIRDSYGPQVLWIRIGNCSKRELIARLQPLIAAVVEALSSGERLVEVN